MKKVININFQGRVIPIEETAYEMLKVYVDSLRRYFANEEGRDEIINDIEGRIAELFSETLKKGAVCITDSHVEAVMASMGRPADFEAQDGESGTNTAAGAEGNYQQGSASGTVPPYSRGRLVRNADDQIIGGVCSGLANYLRIDPVIMRIAFVVLFGALFWVYILLWIIVPSQSVSSNITKRLYRNPDGKILGGVSGGIAAYFHIETWIPRLIFALPLIISLISGSFNAIWWDFDFGFVPRVVSGSLGWTLFLTYIILWIAVPMANTAAEKLEMRGERIDLNSIRDTVNEDLGGFRSKAEKFSGEVKATAQQMGEKARAFGQEAGDRAKAWAAEAGPVAKKTGSGIGHIIGVLFKAFFLFIAAIIAITLFMVFIGLIFGGFTLLPFKDFVLDGFAQNLMAWASVFLFFGIPVIALITWIVRRIIGARSKSHYLGYVFGSLWIIGLICTITLGGLITRNFTSRSYVEEKVASFQTATNNLRVEVKGNNYRYYESDWFGLDNDNEWPIYGLNNDSLALKQVRVNVVKSPDSFYHVYRVKFGRGNSRDQAMRVASKIDFEIEQRDSLLQLPKGFFISSDEKFRNQQVLVVVEVPVGSRIRLAAEVDDYDWFSINFNRRRGWEIRDEQEWGNSYSWSTNVDYIMTPDGLRRLDRMDENELKNGRFKFKINENGVEFEGEGEIRNDSEYRYRRNRDTIQVRSEEVRISYNENPNSEADGYEALDTKTVSNAEISTPLSVFSRLFQ